MNLYLCLILALLVAGCASLKTVSVDSQREVASEPVEVGYRNIPQTDSILFYPSNVKVTQPQKTMHITKIFLNIETQISACVDEKLLSFQWIEISQSSQEQVHSLNLLATNQRGACMATGNKTVRLQIPFQASLFVSDGEFEKRYRFVSATDERKELFTLLGRGTERTRITFEVESQPR